jgi:hypothetical protein
MAAKVSLRHHFVEEIPQNISDDEDLTDDSTRMIPMIGLKTPAGLLDRFVKRLAKIAAANVKVHGSEDQMSIEIHLSRNGGSDQIRVELDRELHELLQTMEESLATITRRKEGMLVLPHLPFLANIVRTCKQASRGRVMGLNPYLLLFKYRPYRPRAQE